MLDLVDSFVGGPSADVHILTLPKEILLVYAFADCVVLLDAETLEFCRALAFWEVFPGTRESHQHVRRISIEPGMKLIAASSGSQIAFWSLSGTQRDTWRVHSSLSMLGGHEVTAMDCKSGLLAVSTPDSLSVYNLSLEDDLPTWTRKWVIPAPAYSVVRFSPSLVYLAAVAKSGNIVRLYSTPSGRQIQAIKHPRPVKDFIWRFSSKSSRDDLVLFTITIDSTLRIFLPVLDTPHFLQLHATLDHYSLMPGAPDDHQKNSTSNIFWLHDDTLEGVFSAILESHASSSIEDTQLRRIKEMHDGGWDCFARVLNDGSVVVRAVANVDRRPPTLLRQFSLLHSPPSLLSSDPSHLHILRTHGAKNLITITSPPLRAYRMDPLTFFDGRKEGMRLLSQRPSVSETESRRIRQFIRTPDGRGLAVLRTDCVETWNLSSGKHILTKVGSWPSADLVVVLDGGHRVLLYSEASSSITLFPSQPALSLHAPPLSSLFSLPSSENHTTIIGITKDSLILRIRISNIDEGTPELTLLNSTTIPLDGELSLIIPVDPMAWSFSRPSDEAAKAHDVLQTRNGSGELAFWTYDEDKHDTWVCTGKVNTSGRQIRMARCSSAKKTALVGPGRSGEELTIWDSKESEFASGLEYNTVFRDESVSDLDWSSTPDSQSILAVGFSRHVLLLCQQRMTYFDEEPAWGVLGRIEIGHMLPHGISDSIWLSGGTLLIGAGHHILQYGHKHRRIRGTAAGQAGLFEEVARLNGPLPDYHPQMILQCLLWGKTELVKTIIINLDRDLQAAVVHAEEGRSFHWEGLPVENFWMAESAPTPSKVPATKSRPRYSMLFDGPVVVDAEEDDQAFSPKLVERVIQNLESVPLDNLSPNEKAHLTGLIQAFLEADEQRRALDDNGLRYLISLRSFYILNARAASPRAVTPSFASMKSVSQPVNLGRERLRFRDMIWAFHSESQEILLAASTTACGGKMVWNDAKAMGVFLWLNSVETMKSQLEIIARHQYMAGDARDPTACSLFYFALGKVRLVHGLWKQAAWHKEQNAMLKFLSNDFSIERWRTAALKNAYALLGKQRFEYAAAFFLLGGGLKDAVNICIKYLDDFQLAIALARILEQGDEKPILTDILSNVVVPLAFKKGNRWLASWAFWNMKRRDLAVRILVSPLQDVADTLSARITEIGDPNYDDPSLALFFAQLKAKTLQTAKGTSEISGRTEFNFVLQTARVFCRMGCHALAVDIVRSWSFDRPTSTVSASSSEQADIVAPLPGSPVFPRRPLPPSHFRRRSATIVIDMEVPSDPSTRAASPEPKNVQPASPSASEKKETDVEVPVRKAGGIGSLLKTAKQDVSVPEFDMNAFF
ncbi:hypothetical protein SCHPADRAFT_871712 [Schizopora paradoxa]|uniref:RAVE complex protein Rav1 C-terminal domain-containing protein n=1 Tax=Schizopora paradoxa TaxID=27342 RepID=A0A0H2RTA0_9AGAM|nr:hypothetical protein SCHPADRAFT_871712 [Schizopora paradoxa]